MPLHKNGLNSLESETNDFDTKQNATVRYDTVEVENWLKIFRAKYPVFWIGHFCTSCVYRK
jgi:hypothetical protein